MGDGRCCHSALGLSALLIPKMGPVGAAIAVTAAMAISLCHSAVVGRKVLLPCCQSPLVPGPRCCQLCPDGNDRPLDTIGGSGPFLTTGYFRRDHIRVQRSCPECARSSDAGDTVSRTPPTPIEVTQAIVVGVRSDHTTASSPTFILTPAKSPSSASVPSARPLPACSAEIPTRTSASPMSLIAMWKEKRPPGSALSVLDGERSRHSGE